jgi:rubrerythrin
MNHSFGFATKDGKLIKFMPADAMAAMFTDLRVRQRELQITARLRAADQLELIKVQSVKEGKVYDIFYFCEVCNIKAYAPGLCPCCRNELEFRETPQ